MKKIVLGIIAVGLVGCSSSSLQKQDPIFIGHSEKTPSQINKCLAPKWQDLHPQATSIETEYGYKISASDDLFGVLSMALLNKDSNNGTDIKVYAASKGIGDPWGSAARACL